jgi:tetratricopeptide (TPR) repeat protein
MRFQVILFLIFSLLLPFFSVAEKVDSLEQIDFANGLLARGFYQMAKEEYQTFIDNYPDNQYLDEAHFGLAESFFQMSLYEKAILEYKKFIKKSSNKKEKNTAVLRIIEAYLNLGQPDKSLEMLSLLSDVKNQSVKQRALYYQGKIFQKKGDSSKGLSFFSKAAELPVEGRFKSLSFLEAGKIFSAQKKYKKAFSYYQKAFQSADSLQLKNLILFEKGETEFFNQLYQKAISTFKVILDKVEKDKLSQQSFLYLAMSF